MTATVSTQQAEEVDADFLLLPPVRVETSAVLASLTCVPHHSSLLVCSAKYGLTVYSTMNGFAIAYSADIVNTISNAPQHSKPSLPSESVLVSVQLDSNQSVTHLRLSFDQNLIIVATTQSMILSYSVPDLLKASAAPTPKTSTKVDRGDILDILPNPEFMPDIVAVLTADYRLCFIHLTGTVTLVDSPNITAISWSRKGKQIACGTKNGHILRITPNGEVKRDIPNPPQLETGSVSQILWLEDRVLVGVYSEAQSDPDYPPATSIYVVEQDAQSNTTYTLLLDPAAAFSLDRPNNYHMDLLQNWGSDAKHLIVLSNAASTDYGIIACSDTNQWSNWNVLEKFPMTMPLDSQEQDTWPVGMAFDLTSVKPLPPSAPDEPEIPAAPILMILNNIGELMAFHLINTNAPGAYPTMTKHIAVIPKIEKHGVTASEPIPGLKSAIKLPSTTTPAKFESSSTTATFGSTSFGAFGAAAPPTAKPLFDTTKPFNPASTTHGLFGSNAAANSSTPVFGGATKSVFGAPKSMTSTSSSVLGGTVPVSTPTKSDGNTTTPKFSFSQPATGHMSALSQNPAGSSVNPALKQNVAPVFESKSEPKKVTPDTSKPVLPKSTEPIKAVSKQLLNNVKVSDGPTPTAASDDTVQPQEKPSVLVARFDELYNGLSADFASFCKFSKDVDIKVEKMRKRSDITDPSKDLKKLALGDFPIVKSITAELMKRITAARQFNCNDGNVKEELLSGILNIEVKCKECESRLKVITEPESTWTISQNILGPEAQELRTKINAKHYHVQSQIMTIQHNLETLENTIDVHLAKRKELARSANWKMICSTVHHITKAGMVASSRIDQLLTEFHALNLDKSKEGHNAKERNGFRASPQRVSFSPIISKASSRQSSNVFGLHEEDVFADESALYPSLPIATDSEVLAKHTKRRRHRLMLKQVLTRTGRLVPVNVSAGYNIPPKELIRKPLPPRHTTVTAETIPAPVVTTASVFSSKTVASSIPSQSKSNTSNISTPAALGFSFTNPKPADIALQSKPTEYNNALKPHLPAEPSAFGQATFSFKDSPVTSQSKTEAPMLAFQFLPAKNMPAAQFIDSPQAKIDDQDDDERDSEDEAAYDEYLLKDERESDDQSNSKNSASPSPVKSIDESIVDTLHAPVHPSAQSPIQTNSKPPLFGASLSAAKINFTPGFSFDTIGQSKDTKSTGLFSAASTTFSFGAVSGDGPGKNLFANMSVPLNKDAPLDFGASPSAFFTSTPQSKPTSGLFGTNVKSATGNAELTVTQSSSTEPVSTISKPSKVFVETIPAMDNVKAEIDLADDLAGQTTTSSVHTPECSTSLSVYPTADTNENLESIENDELVVSEETQESQFSKTNEQYQPVSEADQTRDCENVDNEADSQEFQDQDVDNEADSQELQDQDVDNEADSQEFQDQDVDNEADSQEFQDQDVDNEADSQELQDQDVDNEADSQELQDQDVEGDVDHTVGDDSEGVESDHESKDQNVADENDEAEPESVSAIQVSTDDAQSTTCSAFENSSLVFNVTDSHSDTESFDIVRDDMDDLQDDAELSESCVQTPNAHTPENIGQPVTTLNTNPFGTSSFFGGTSSIKPHNVINPMFKVGTTTASATTGSFISQSPGFGNSVFGSSSTMPNTTTFTTSALNQSQFASTTSFGQAPVTSQASSVFGSYSQNTNQQQVFGQSSFGSGPAMISPFASAQHTPVFGQSGFGAASSSPFGSGLAPSIATATSGGGGFGAFASGNTSGFASFGQKQPQGGSIFGSGADSSIFGSAQQERSAFGSAQQERSAFGSARQQGSTPGTSQNPSFTSHRG
ncbi:hypothetical protein O5D80_005250 [Batrachochytrium dendrobatidis]|nr:hypothetical protein O5D80_005250 [Batrachochytrium dendrobatidis]